MKDSTAIKWIAKNSKSQRLNLILLIIANAIFAALSVLFALAVKVVVEAAVDKDSKKLLYSAIFVVGVILLQFLFRVITRCLQEYIRGKLTIQFKNLVLGSIFSKKYAKISSYHSGELLNVATSDVDVVTEGVTEIVPEVFSALVRLICAIVALIVINWVFAVAFSVAGVAILLVTTLMRKKIKHYHKLVQKTDGTAKSYFQENLENSLVVKAFSGEKRVLEKADALQQENFKVKMKRRNFSVLGHSVFHFVASAGYVFALIYGGVLIFNGGSFGYGDLTAVLQLVNSVQMPFMSLSSVFPKYFTMLSSAERIMAIENLEDEEISSDFDVENTYAQLKSINLQDVSFGYGIEKVLENVNLSINKGETVAIIGGSGNGKSTLFKLLLGVYDDYLGRIYISSQNEEKNLSVQTRKLFCYVPQGNYIFSGTIYENLTFINPSATSEQIEKVLKLCCLTEVISALPDGLESRVGENGQGLSEGQLQRLAIARGLLAQAPILLLDEVTSALDEKTEKTILDNIKALKNKTVIIVTHKKAALDICDKKILIDQKTVQVL